MNYSRACLRDHRAAATALDMAFLRDRILVDKVSSHTSEEPGLRPAPSWAAAKP